ncbi:MAG: SIS domain-containing protein, partial [Anaerolineales bacterium]|nr:SIS domain-containing protein [Anaerolineales bacterium]
VPIKVDVIPSTEFAYYGDRLLNPQTVVVIVSRSGERGWVVEAMDDAKRRGALGVAMTGVADSLLAQHAQVTLLTAEGPEITFPKTKSVLACVGLLMRLGLELADPKDGEAVQRRRTLAAAAAASDKVVGAAEDAVRTLMPKLAKHSTVFMGGTGSNYGAALEGAVKLQETAYVTTLSDHTGNIFHGALGPLNKDWLILPLVHAADTKLVLQLLRLVRKFGAHSLAVAEPGVDLQGLSDYTISLPERTDPLLAALSYLPVLQLLTYYWTVERKLNPDEPSIMRDMLDAMLPVGRQEPELRKG